MRRPFAPSLLLLSLACRPAAETAEPKEDPAPRASAEVPEAAAVVEEQSVKPGINEAWKSDDIEPLVGRLEAEDREVFAHRDAIVGMVAAKPGDIIADVGSGSGFLTEALARSTGSEGKVFAVDINQKLLDQVRARMDKAGLDNVETVLSGDKGGALAPNSVDLIFVCDTYHHFEYPKTVLASLHAALRPGGALVVIDFKRIEGETEQWILDHVRAGQDVVTQEITTAGFELVETPTVEGLVENYALRFVKPPG